MGTSVLALAPLLANMVPEAAAASPPGSFDFETPLNRLGTDSVHWDQPMRDEKMSRIVAGMGVADMDFRCAPVIMAGLAKRMRHENWGYIDEDAPGPEAFRQSIIDWNHRRHGIAVMRSRQYGDQHRRPYQHRGSSAGRSPAGQQGADDHAHVQRFLCRSGVHGDHRQ